MYKQKRSEELQFLKATMFGKQLSNEQIDDQIKKLKILMRNIP